MDPKPKGSPLVGTEHNPLPQAQDIFSSLVGCSVFSFIDLYDARLQLPVVIESQHLLTLSTHQGLIRLTWLPFGLSSSLALFQDAIDQILSGISGTGYLNDVLIGASLRDKGFKYLKWFCSDSLNMVSM